MLVSRKTEIEKNRSILGPRIDFSGVFMTYHVIFADVSSIWERLGNEDLDSKRRLALQLQRVYVLHEHEVLYVVCNMLYAKENTTCTIRA